MKNSDYILYLDLDGVIVDYSTGWWVIAKLLGIKPVSGDKYDKEDIARVYHQTMNPEFWSSLNWEHGGKHLWEAANNLFDDIHILTSTAAKKDVEKHKIVEIGKRVWIKEHLYGLHPNNIHVVPEGIEKAKFASPLSILVDDRASTIKAFDKAGGYGILHNPKKYQDTIDELEYITNPPMGLGESLPLVRRQFWGWE